MITLTLPGLVLGFIILAICLRLLTLMFEARQHQREARVAANYVRRIYHELREESGRQDQAPRDGENAGVLASAVVIFLLMLAYLQSAIG